MIDHNLLKTGFDYETLFSADYFLTIIQTAYDYEKIPDELDLGDSGSLLIGRPSTATILHDNNDADLEIDVGVDYNGLLLSVSLTFKLLFDDSKITLQFVDIDNTTRQLIIAFANQETLDTILATLSTQVNQEVPISLGNNVAQLEVKKLAPTPNHQAAIGLYANGNLQIASQSQKPEEDFIERGDLNLATNFLPADQDYAIGLSSTTFQRLANHAWHQTGEERGGKLLHPIYDPKDIRKWQAKLASNPDEKKPDPVGKFVSFSIKPLNGFVRMVVKSEIFIDFWPDADVTAIFHLTPTLANGNLVMNTELEDYDVDTGLLGDLLAFLTLGLLGIIALEIVEAVIEAETDDAVEQQGQDQAADAFSGLLASFNLFTERLDPFYKTHIKLKHFYENAKVDALGMSLSGSAVIEPVDEPVPIEIIDKQRSLAFPQYQNLMSLFYRVPDFDGGDRIELLMSEVLTRITNQQLSKAEMRPTQVNRKNTIIRDLKFSTGVDFTVNATIFLFKERVLSIPGYELIEPRRPGVYGKVAHAYFRDKADRSLEDNLDELPAFTPE